MTMVTLGVDAHKRSHTLVAVDGTGLQLAALTVPATAIGHAEALRWAQTWGARRWAIEDCRHVTQHLEAALMAAGEAVVRVPPHLTAVLRRTVRRRGKSDAIDALAIAQACQREPGLPSAYRDQRRRDLRLLVDRRDVLIAERTRTQNRVRWHLHELDPATGPVPRSLDRYCVINRLEQIVQGHSGVLARIISAELNSCRSLTREINGLEREIQGTVRQLAPSLLALKGCGGLAAAKIVGQVGWVSRFHSSSAFARHNGTAPIPVSSGNQSRFRLCRGGNRQINCALHQIALTQLRIHPPAKEYVAQLRERGKTHREAVRCLRRHLSNEVYRRLRADEAPVATPLEGDAAA